MVYIKIKRGRRVFAEHYKSLTVVLDLWCIQDKTIITNAYKKQSQKMPPREKERALKLKEDYTKRCNEGSYYD